MVISDPVEASGAAREPGNAHQVHDAEQHMAAHVADEAAQEIRGEQTAPQKWRVGHVVLWTTVVISIGMEAWCRLAATGHQSFVLA